MTSNTAVNFLRMFCACGDTSTVFDETTRNHDAMDFDEVSLYEEVCDKTIDKTNKQQIHNGSPTQTLHHHQKMTKMMPSPISVFSYPFEEGDEDSSEEDDDDWEGLPYLQTNHQDAIFSSRELSSSTPPSLRLSPRLQPPPSISRASSGATATTVSMNASEDGGNRGDFNNYPEVRDDEMDFDVSSTLSTEIVQNPNRNCKNYLPSSMDSVFRDTTNNTSRTLSSSSIEKENENQYKPQLIRMSHENYVHSPSISKYPGTHEKKVLAQQRGGQVVVPSLIHHHQ